MKLNKTLCGFITSDGLFTIEIMADNTCRVLYGECTVVVGSGDLVRLAVFFTSMRDCMSALDIIYYFIKDGVDHCKNTRINEKDINKTVTSLVDPKFANIPSVIFQLVHNGYLLPSFGVSFKDGSCFEVTDNTYGLAKMTSRIKHPESGAIIDSSGFTLDCFFKATAKLENIAKQRENNKPERVVKLIAEIKALESKLSAKKFELKESGYCL